MTRFFRSAFFPLIVIVLLVWLASQTLIPKKNNAEALTTSEAIAQVKTTITVVRMAVARFESIPVTPTLARRAVAAAKKAERSAQKIQFIWRAYSSATYSEAFSRSTVSKSPRSMAVRI